MRNTGVIIFLIIIAIQAIGAIVKTASKEKQKAQQRLAQQAAQQRRAATGRSAQAGVPSSGGPVGGGSAPGNPLDKLAERRRAQLEQLRQRRQGRSGSGGTPPTQMRTGAPSRGRSPLPGTPGPPTASSQGRVSAFEEIGRAEEARRTTRQRQADTAHRTRQAEMPTTQQSASDRSQTRGGGRLLPDSDSGHAGLQSRPTQLDRAQPLSSLHSLGDAERESRLAPALPSSQAIIRGRLRSAAELRRLFVLKELIDPPISLR